ncbi:unnamed protein product [Closterium sp. NIES-54]
MRSRVADISTRSQWLSRDATARLAICNHLPATECAHFGEHRTAQALYDAVVARYSSPATAALGRLLLPYLFPELSVFATVADQGTHLRTSDARYRAAVPAGFLPTNQAPMFITLYFIVTRLPDSLRSVRDHFLTLDPTSLTVDLLEQHLLKAETSAVAVVRSAATARARVAGVVEEAAVVVEVAVGVAVGSAVEEAEAAEVEALVAAVEAAEGVAAVEAVGPVVVVLDLSVAALVAVGASSSSVGARLRRLSSSVSAAAALGASVSGTPPGTTPAEALHTFTLDSSALRCFFRDSTTLTPLPAPVPVRLADPSGGPVVASSSTVLPCSAVPSGSLSGLHLPSFSTNLVSTAALQDAMVTTTTPGGQCVLICTSTRTRRHLATFTRRPGSSLYTLATEPPRVTASAQVSASGQVAASCSCRLLSHRTLLWHHRLGHLSLPRLRGMHSRLLGHKRYFLLVVDDYTRYTTVFPLRSKGEVSAVLIPWIRTVRLQLRARFGQDLPVLRLHSDRAGEFSSDLLRDFCRGEGISQSSTSGPVSPCRRPRPHCVGGGRLAMRQCSRAFVRDTPAGKLSARAIPCVFLGFVPDAPSWQFYHPTSCRVLPSQDVTFDESVPFYRLFPYCSAPSPPPPLFLVPGQPPVDPLPPQGPAPSGVSHLDALTGTAPVQEAIVLGAAPGAASGGAEPGGAGSEGAGSGAGASGGAGAEGAAVSTGVGDPTEPGAAGAGGAGAGVAGVGGPGAGGAGDAGAGAVDPGTGGAGGTERPRPYFIPLLQEVLGVPSSTGLPPPFLCPPPDQSQPPLQPASPLPVPSPYTEESGGLTERREPASRPVSPVLTARRASRSCPPPVPGTHTMALRPSSVPLSRAASPTVARLLATAVSDPSFESVAASALIAELLDFAAACRLDYASALVA